MNTDQILSTTVRSIKSAMPEAIYAGTLVKKETLFDSSSSVSRIIESVLTPVEIIFDSFKSEEILGSNILSTDVKLHVIANEVKDINFYTVVRVGNDDYTIKQKIEAVIGSKTALFTIVAQL